MEKKLTISIGENFSQLKQQFSKALDTGEYQGEVMSYETPETLFKTLSPKKWTIVSAVQNSQAIAVRELARQINRDERRVHDDLIILIEEGILQQDEKDRISCPYEVIYFEFELKRDVA